MAANAVIPPPPRVTGDMPADFKAIIEWMWSFYNAAVTESGLLDPNFQATAAVIDPNNLPDPTDTTIATAQATANAAIGYLLAHSLIP